MKTIIGALLMIAGVAVGIYCGLWWAFIGGIVDVVREIRADDLNALSLAIGIAKVFFAGFIGWASAGLGMVPGYLLLKSGCGVGASRARTAAFSRSARWETTER